MRLGYRVIIVPDGQRLLQHPLLNRAAVILMDGQMPHLDGYQAARQLRQREAQLGRPYIIIASPLTAHPTLAVARSPRHERPPQQAVEIDALERVLAAHLPARASTETPGAAWTQTRWRSSGLISNGDDALLYELTRDFLDALPERLDALRHASHHDPRAVAKLAHGLKSNAHTLGARELGARCAALEAAARDGRELVEPIRAVEDAAPGAEAALRALLP